MRQIIISLAVLVLATLACGSEPTARDIEGRLIAVYREGWPYATMCRSIIERTGYDCITSDNVAMASYHLGPKDTWAEIQPSNAKSIPDNIYFPVICLLAVGFILIMFAINRFRIFDGDGHWSG